MKKNTYLLIFSFICLIGIGIGFFVRTIDEVKIYKRLNEIDVSIIETVAHSQHVSMSDSISNLQQTFEELVGIGVTFTEEQDVSEIFNRFDDALENSKQLEQRLVNLFQLEKLNNLERLYSHGDDTQKEIINLEEIRIQQLKSISSLLEQVNMELDNMDTMFYCKKNKVVFNYIMTVREYFNQIKAEFEKYSQSVAEYMNHKATYF